MLKRIGVLTSGGDSPGMNPAIRSITRAGLSLGMEIVGIENGYQGIFDRQFVPLGVLEVSGKIRDAGTFLGSSRCARFRDADGPAEALQILRSENIQGLIVIGGDGSLTGANILSGMGYPVIGLPGTIDNDLYGTDMGIGVDTCLNTIITLVDMIKATAASHRRCFIIEVMGRGSGYLALMSTISSGSQVAVIPEFRYNMDNVIETLNRRILRKHNNSVVIVAEGVCSGQEFKNKLLEREKDLLVKEIRLTVLGHVQRGGSPTHFDRTLASRMGEFAILALSQGESGSMTALVNGKIQLRDFSQILGRRKDLPGDAIRLARNLGIEIGDVVET
jgi:6-phosphofructokinase 1